MSETVALEQDVCTVTGPIVWVDVARKLQDLSEEYTTIEINNVIARRADRILEKIPFTPKKVRLSVACWEPKDLETFAKKWFDGNTLDIRVLRISDLRKECSQAILYFAKTFRRKKSKLRSLTFNNMLISPKEPTTYFQQLASYLLHTSESNRVGLYYLRLNDINLGEVGVSAFAARLKNNSKLRTFNVEKTNSHHSVSFISSVVKKLQINMSLETVKLDYPASITDVHSSKHSLTGTLYINSILRENSYYENCYDEEAKSLRLYDEGIDQYMANAGFFQQISRKYPNVVHLDISSNEIRALNLDMVKCFTQLESLDATDNILCIISPAICTHPTLKNFKFDAECVANIPKIFLSNGFDGIKIFYDCLDEKQEYNRIQSIAVGLVDEMKLKRKFIRALCSHIGPGNKKRPATASIEVTFVPKNANTNKHDDSGIIFSCMNIASQSVFDTCNPVLMGSGNTIYFALFNVTNAPELLDNLNTIQGSAPGTKVFLVSVDSYLFSPEELQVYSQRIEAQIKRWKRRMGSNSIQFIPPPSNDPKLFFWTTDWNSKDPVAQIHAAVNEMLKKNTKVYPRKYLAFLRLIRENREISYNPIILGYKLKIWAKEFKLNSKEFAEVLTLLSDWGELIYYPFANDLVMINVPNIGDIMNVTCQAIDTSLPCLDTSVTVSDIENLWEEAGFIREYFESHWNVLFSMGVCTTLPKDNCVLFPHLAPPYVEKTHSFTRILRLRKSECPDVICRSFVFDFMMPGFTTRLLNRLLTEFHQISSIEISSTNIFVDAIQFQLSRDKEGATVQLLIHQQKTPQEDNLFQTTINIQITSTPKEIEFARRIFAFSGFLVDNFVRDQFPQLHENHMSIFIRGNSGRKEEFINSREQIAKAYFSQRLREICQIPMESLIPEVLNPVGVFLTSCEAKVNEFNQDELTVQEKLGSGKSGAVFKALWKNKNIAWKVFNNEAIDEYLLRDFCQEVSVLSILTHPNVVELVGFVLEPSLSVALEFCGGGTLESALRKHEHSKSLDWKLLVKMGLDIARALCYLHSKKPAIIHNDLKPDNIMVVDLDPDAPVCLKLIDFGFSVATMDSTKKDIQSFGTMFEGIIEFYASPEGPSATVPVAPTKKHPETTLFIPDTWKKIITACHMEYTAEDLEYKFYRLWNKILLGADRFSLSKQGSSISADFENLANLLSSANDKVFIQLLRKLDSDTIYRERKLIGQKISEWIDNDNFDMLDAVFQVVDLNITFGEFNETAVMYAARTGNCDSLEYLLDSKEIDVNQQNEMGQTAAHSAVSNGKFNTLSVLITKYSADLHSETASIIYNDSVFSMYHSAKLESLETTVSELNVLDYALFIKCNYSVEKQIDAQEDNVFLANVDQCICLLFSAGCKLTAASSKLPDRIEYLRIPLRIFFGCELESNVGNIKYLLGSVNNREFSRIQKLMDLALSDSDHVISPSAVGIDKHIWNFTSIPFITISNDSNFSITVEILYRPEWLKVSLAFDHISKGGSDRAYGSYISFALEDVSLESVILCVQNKKQVIRYIIIRLEDTNRNKTIAAPPKPHTNQKTVISSCGKSKAKLGGAITFSSNK